MFNADSAMNTTPVFHQVAPVNQTQYWVPMVQISLMVPVSKKKKT